MGGGGGRLMCAASVATGVLHMYIRTCTYQLLTECQVPTFKDVSSVG